MVLSSLKSLGLWWLQPQELGAEVPRTRILHLCHLTQLENSLILLLIGFFALCLHVCVCTHTHAHACTQTQRPEVSACFSTSVFLIHLKQSLSVNLSSPFQLSWLPSEFSIPACVCPPVLGLQVHRAMCGFCIGTGDLNSVTHVYMASVLTCWSIFPTLISLFGVYWGNIFIRSKCLRNWPNFLGSHQVSTAFCHNCISKLSASNSLIFTV